MCASGEIKFIEPPRAADRGSAAKQPVVSSHSFHRDSETPIASPPRSGSGKTVSGRLTVFGGGPMGFKVAEAVSAPGTQDSFSSARVGAAQILRASGSRSATRIRRRRPDLSGRLLEFTLRECRP